MAKIRLVIAVVVGVVVVGCIPEMKEPDQPERQPFMTPLRGLTALLADDPVLRKACSSNQYDRLCSKLFYVGPDNAGPVIVPAFTSEPQPNLMVVFAVTKITHEVVSGSGPGTSGSRFWLDSSADLDDEYPPAELSTNIINPLPGTTRTYDNFIWNAVILDGCNSPPSVIPIEFRHSSHVASEGVIGEFEATDDTSLVSTGFWTFQYTLRASILGGAEVSDFHVRGTVSVFCTRESHADDPD